MIARWITTQRDPRVYQIAVLSALVLYGTVVLAFDIEVASLGLILGSALATQWLCTRLWRLPRFDPRSAGISGLSLCLLLRTDGLMLAAVAAAITIASKFVLRVNGKHLFNPTNFGLVAMMAWSDRVWVSAGQWGSMAYFGLLLACLGALVVSRAARSDVTYAFLLAYVTLVCGRAWWLGDPPAIPLHQLQNGALLIFGFFMISDPKTTPDTRAGRILFACLVAVVAGYIQFGLFQPNALLWALVACAPVAPVLDWLHRGRRYQWLMGLGDHHRRPSCQNGIAPSSLPPCCWSVAPRPRHFAAFMSRKPMPDYSIKPPRS